MKIDEVKPTVSVKSDEKALADVKGLYFNWKVRWTGDEVQDRWFAAAAKELADALGIEDI